MTNMEAATALAIRGRQRIARGLVDGEFEPAKYMVGGAMGLNLTDRLCSLCEGLFAPTGFVVGFYLNEQFVVLHKGCTDEASNWTGAE